MCQKLAEPMSFPLPARLQFPSCESPDPSKVACRRARAAHARRSLPDHQSRGLWDGVTARAPTPESLEAQAKAQRYPTRGHAAALPCRGSKPVRRRGSGWLPGCMRSIKYYSLVKPVPAGSGESFRVSFQYRASPLKSVVLLQFPKRRKQENRIRRPEYYEETVEVEESRRLQQGDEPLDLPRPGLAW